MASNCCGVRLLLIVSITVQSNPFQFLVLTSSVHKNVRVTFSSRISNCFNVAPKSLWACSSTTRTFHRPGGFTERIASRKPVNICKMISLRTLQTMKTYDYGRWWLKRASGWAPLRQTRCIINLGLRHGNYRTLFKAQKERRSEN